MASNVFHDLMRIVSDLPLRCSFKVLYRNAFATRSSSKQRTCSRSRGPRTQLGVQSSGNPVRPRVEMHIINAAFEGLSGWANDHDEAAVFDPDSETLGDKSCVAAVLSCC